LDNWLFIAIMLIVEIKKQTTHLFQPGTAPLLRIGVANALRMRENGVDAVIGARK
jgi:hypothetical protein